MKPRARRFPQQFGALFVAVLTFATFATGADIWKTLPPTPSLPKAAKSTYAPINDIQMWYAIVGNGRPVLLLHGGLSNSDDWADLVPVLLRNHYQVIVADSRGHGRSTRSSQAYSYDLMASDVIALLDYLELNKVDLVGWSNGGNY